MEFHFGLYSSILLIFFFHGVVFSALTLKIGLAQSSKSSLWMSLILLLIALYISPFMLGYAGWYALDGYQQILFFLPLQQLLFIGPAFLFYLKSLLYPQSQLKTIEWLHFLPGIAYLLYSLWMFVFDYFIYDQLYYYQDGRDRDLDSWYQIAGFLSLISYFILSLSVYQKYRKQIFDNFSYAEEITYNWVRYFLWTFLTILVLRALFFVFNPEWGEFGRKFWYYLAISGVGYYLAIQGYKQCIIQIHSTLPLFEAPDNKPVALPIDENELDVTKSEIQKEEYAAWANQIEKLMQDEQLFRNPVLKLSDLADQLQTTTKNISTAINKGTDLNFNDYVNRFRVEAVIQEIEAGTHIKKTLLAIAISCGFNSKSTFNRAFKKHLAINPVEYIAQRSK